MVRPQIRRDSENCLQSRHNDRVVGSWMTDASSVVCIKEVQWSCQHDCHHCYVVFVLLFAFHFNSIQVNEKSISLSPSLFLLRTTPHSQGPFLYHLHVHSTTQLNLKKLTINQSLTHSINHTSLPPFFEFLFPFTHSLSLLYHHYHLPPLFNNTFIFLLIKIQYCSSIIKIAIRVQI